jgi:hypothetical protein
VIELFLVPPAIVALHALAEWMRRRLSIWDSRHG